MTRTALTFGFIAVFFATAVEPSPIYARSELQLSHSMLINSGNMINGIDIGYPGTAFQTTHGATSMVDHPDAYHNEISDTIVGNIFATPPIAFQDNWLDTTALPGDSEGAQSGYNISVLLTNGDGAVNQYEPINQDVEQYGRAVAQITSEPVAAAAQSWRTFERDFTFENITDHLISFNIVGLFTAELLAEYNGEDGFARTSGGFDLLFQNGDDVRITYFAIAPYLFSSTESGAGASVSEQLLINEAGVSGVSFNASASAFGDGGTSSAHYQGESRYIFGISMDPGAFLRLNVAFRQNNAVDYSPQPQSTPVPVPGSLSLLFVGLAFAALRNRFTPMSCNKHSWVLP